MNTSKFVCIVLLGLLALACGSPNTQSKSSPVAPIKIDANLGTVDVCGAIPKENIESAIGRKLVAAPQKTDLPDVSGSNGCSYDAGKDSKGNAYFGYAVLTPANAFDNAPGNGRTSVSGIGREAYFTNAADARQLWVKVNDSAAVVVAFGDAPNEDAAKSVAKQIADAIK